MPQETQIKGVILYTPEVRRLHECGSVCVVRAVKPSRHMRKYAREKYGDSFTAEQLMRAAVYHAQTFINNSEMTSCPFGAPKSTLYCKETVSHRHGATWCYDADNREVNRWDDEKWMEWFRAWDDERDEDALPRIAANQMPREFSRFTLTLKSVRVGQVQGVTEDEARAAGWGGYTRSHIPGDQFAGNGPRTWFRKQWELKHGPGAWHRNDWCWIASLAVAEGAAQ